MKIKNKLLLVFLGLASMGGLVGFLAISCLKQITADMIQVKESSIVQLGSATDMTLDLVLINGLSREYIHQAIDARSSGSGLIKIKLEERFMSFEKALNLTKNTIRTEDEKDKLKQVESLERKYRIYKNDIVEVISNVDKSGDVRKYTSPRKEWSQRDSILLGDLRLFKKEVQDDISFESAQLTKVVRKSTIIIIAMTVLCFILAMVAWVFVSRSILNPIFKITAAVKNISPGNMNIIKNVRSADEIAELTVSFNKMAQDLEKNRIEVEENSKKLEHKVKELTNELAKLITDEQRARYETEQANKDLRSKNKEIEEFAYVVSHDLQEPLRTISSFVGFLKKQYQGTLDEKTNKYFTFIVEASERMKTLIKDLLDYSRIGSKKELAEVDCDKVLRNVIADLGIAINESGALITHDSLPVIIGYPTELKQLFQNLVINAIKFRNKDKPPEINISVQKLKDYWHFAIKDNGIGIEQEHNQRIFVIFQRLHNRTEYDGCGIGLSHCKKIVELHKGKIWVESVPGVGSTFRFTLSSEQLLSEIHTDAATVSWS